MRILNYNIPEDLQENSFIISLEKQSLEKGTLTDNQTLALKSMLDIEILVEPFHIKSVKKYAQYYFRADYHGDMLRDHSFVYDVSEYAVDNKIQDLHAAQYSAEAYVNEFRLVETLDIPENVENVSYFMNFYFEDFQFLTKKIARNKFRTVKSKNAAINALNSLTSGNVDPSIVDKSIYKVKY